jgi:hypothetical protein
LAQAALLINDEIVRGVAEDIITVNPIFSYMPFYGYEGQAIVVNRELTLGGDHGSGRTVAGGLGLTRMGGIGFCPGYGFGRGFRGQCLAALADAPVQRLAAKQAHQ